MKKSIIALAVLATMAAQADNTTLYGSIRMGYDYSDKGALDVDGSTDSTSTFQDKGSRFGIKGSEDLGGGLSALYQYENRLGGGTAATNKLYVGLKGDFGQVTAGLQSLPADEMGEYSDPFNELTPRGHATITSSNNSVVYWTPDMGNGLRVGAAMVADGATPVDRDGDGAIDSVDSDNVVLGPNGWYNNSHNHIDAYDIAVLYANSGFVGGLGYQSTNIVGGTDDANTITASFGYGNDTFSVGVIADKYDFGGNNDPFGVRLSGAYNWDASNSIYAGFGMFDPDVAGTDEAKNASVGYEYKFSDRTKVWAEYRYTGGSSNFLDGGTLAGKTSEVSLGLRTDF